MKIENILLFSLNFQRGLKHSCYPKNHFSRISIYAFNAWKIFFQFSFSLLKSDSYFTGDFAWCLGAFSIGLTSSAYWTYFFLADRDPSKIRGIFAFFYFRHTWPTFSNSINVSVFAASLGVVCVYVRLRELLLNFLGR